MIIGSGLQILPSAAGLRRVMFRRTGLIGA
jgi:hypothetical protein